MNLFTTTHTPTVGASGDQEHRILVEGGYQPDMLVVAAGEPVTLIFHRVDVSLC